MKQIILILFLLCAPLAAQNMGGNSTSNPPSAPSSPTYHDLGGGRGIVPIPTARILVYLRDYQHTKPPVFTFAYVGSSVDKIIDCDTWQGVWQVVMWYYGGMK